jgi:hypothetical protein
MANEEDFAKGYIKGYKEGLQKAWEELVRLASRGYTPKELQIMVKSSQTMLMQSVDVKIAELEKSLGRKLSGDEKAGAQKGHTLAPMGPGMSICFKEERPERGPGIVRELLAHGSKVLSISRMHPDQLRSRFGFEGRMIWLTKSESVGEPRTPEEKIDFISPTNLPVLADAIQQFLSEQSNGAVFLEGLEYLTTQNDFKGVLRFVQLMNEQVLLRKGILIISVNPATMDPREFSLIETEMTQVA